MASNHIASQLEMGLEVIPRFTEKETSDGEKPMSVADVYACSMYKAKQLPPPCLMFASYELA